MLSRWENPPSGLQLADLAHALHPGVVDYLSFADFPEGLATRRYEADIAMNRVVGKVFAEVGVHSEYLMEFAESVYQPMWPDAPRRFLLFLLLLSIPQTHLDEIAQSDQK